MSICGKGFCTRANWSVCQVKVDKLAGIEKALRQPLVVEKNGYSNSSVLSNNFYVITT